MLSAKIIDDTFKIYVHEYVEHTHTQTHTHNVYLTHSVYLTHRLTQTTDYITVVRELCHGTKVLVSIMKFIHKADKELSHV